MKFHHWIHNSINQKNDPSFIGIKVDPSFIGVKGKHKYGDYFTKCVLRF